MAFQSAMRAFALVPTRNMKLLILDSYEGWRVKSTHLCRSSMVIVATFSMKQSTKASTLWYSIPMTYRLLEARAHFDAVAIASFMSNDLAFDKRIFRKSITKEKLFESLFANANNLWREKCKSIRLFFAMQFSARLVWLSSFVYKNIKRCRIKDFFLLKIFMES